jgi:hypothetical protein
MARYAQKEVNPLLEAAAAYAAFLEWQVVMLSELHPEVKDENFSSEQFREMSEFVVKTHDAIAALSERAGRARANLIWKEKKCAASHTKSTTG